MKNEKANGAKSGSNKENMGTGASPTKESDGTLKRETLGGDKSLDNIQIPERQVSEEDILEFTKRTGLSVFEGSAKSGTGVESSFIALTDALIDQAVKNGSTKSKNNDSAYSSQSNSHAQENPYYSTDNNDPPFDDTRIKMKKI